MKQLYKIVMVELKVPIGSYCFKWAGGPVCDHLDNSNFHATCGMGFDNIVHDNFGYKKPRNCNKLERASC